MSPTDAVMDRERALDKRTFLGNLTEEQRSALSTNARMRPYADGWTPLVHEGELLRHAIVLLKGWVRVTSTTADGHEAMLDLLGPGDVIGEAAILYERPSVATIRPLTQVNTWVIPAPRFMSFLDSSPTCWRALHDVALRRIDAARQRARTQVAGDGTRQVAALLSSLVETHGQEHAQAQVLPPLTQEQLGSWIGVSRLTVARALRILREEGLVATAHRVIIILDPDGLDRFIQ
jgi:CRP/FNR family cyclic AMP-dependent transcriptional regulator